MCIFVSFVSKWCFKFGNVDSHVSEKSIKYSTYNLKLFFPVGYSNFFLHYNAKEYKNNNEKNIFIWVRINVELRKTREAAKIIGNVCLWDKTKEFFFQKFCVQHDGIFIHNIVIHSPLCKARLRHLIIMFVGTQITTSSGLWFKFNGNTVNFQPRKPVDKLICSMYGFPLFYEIIFKACDETCTINMDHKKRRFFQWKNSGS